MSGAAAPPATRPVVHLVGAGPGDPRLLTRRAARLLAAAEVVVLDRRSLQAIAALAPPAAERCFVGRTGAGPGWETERIADLLADRAATGRTVVRLKSGDPFVCSRGGEERLALLQRGVTCDVVPGVSAATAAPLAAGMPRGRTVTILAGNDDPAYPPLDVATLADPASSLVVLTGRSQQGVIASTLMAAGLAPATPFAVVHGATRPGERVVRGILADLGAIHLPAPATVVIGPLPEPDCRPEGSRAQDRSALASRAEGGRAEGGRAEGGRAEGGRAEGGRAERGRALASRALDSRARDSGAHDSRAEGSRAHP